MAEAAFQRGASPELFIHGQVASWGVVTGPSRWQGHPDDPEDLTVSVAPLTVDQPSDWRGTFWSNSSL